MKYKEMRKKLNDLLAANMVFEKNKFPAGVGSRISAKSLIKKFEKEEANA